MLPLQQYLINGGLVEEVAVAPLFLLPWSLLPQKLHLLLFEPFLKKKKEQGGGGKEEEGD